MAVMLLCGVASAKAMDEQSGLQEAFLQRMTSMAEAATRAAAAAERALERSSTSTGSNEGLSAASRILKAPRRVFRRRCNAFSTVETSIYKLVVFR